MAAEWRHSSAVQRRLQSRRGWSGSYGRHEGVGVVGEVVLRQYVDDDGALDTLGEGVLAGVPPLLFEIGGLVPRDVLERVPLLRDREMTVEQAGGGSGELFDENMVLARVHYEISHVLSFAGCTSPPAGTKRTGVAYRALCPEPAP